MRHLPAIALICLWLAGAAAAQDAPPDPIDLRPTWVDGQTSRYRIVTERLTTVRLADMAESHSSHMKLTSQVTWQVIDADDGGGGTCRMTINDMQVVLTDPAGREHTVTRTRADEEHLKPVQNLLKGMTAKPLTVTVASDGRVTDVAGWQKVRTAAGEAGENITETDFHEAATDLALLVGGPAQTAAGDRWSEKFDWDHQTGTLHLDTTFTLIGTETIADIPIATIDSNSDLTLTVDKAKLGERADRTTVRLKDGTESMQVIYDLSRHEAVGRNTDRSLTLEMTLQGSGSRQTRYIDQRIRSQVLRIAEQ
jgi:hypothetical protein